MKTQTGPTPAPGHPALDGGVAVAGQRGFGEGSDLDCKAGGLGRRSGRRVVRREAARAGAAARAEAEINFANFLNYFYHGIVLDLILCTDPKTKTMDNISSPTNQTHTCWRIQALSCGTRPLRTVLELQCINPAYCTSAWGAASWRSYHPQASWDLQWQHHDPPRQRRRLLRVVLHTVSGTVKSTNSSQLTIPRPTNARLSISNRRDGRR